MLVAIASYGVKNLGLLKKTIQQYQAMSMSVDVVVLSEGPKDLPPDVRVQIGLPSKNPWSLPFAHKSLFAANVNNYDLFVYSEDDMGVTEDNIEAFLRATDVLKDDEIAGFLRYEKARDGSIWMPDAHSTFHWQPDSVVERGGQVFAQYTNEHAAFYILTREQLGRAIASNGFLREPYEGSYDMLCAAATDPYTSCGFRKLVGVSTLSEFLIHHMSDRYAGQMGLPLSVFEEQVDTLHAIHQGEHPATSLCTVESRVARGEWSKDYYERPHAALMRMVPDGAKTIVSIGCGWGAMEAELRERGSDVVVLPLDSVIGAAAAKRGLKPVYGDLERCLAKLPRDTFDCVVISNLLHLQQDPADLFRRCADLVKGGGSIVIDSPNFGRVPILATRLFGTGKFPEVRTFEEGGVTTLGPGTLSRAARQAGLSADDVRWYDQPARWAAWLRFLPRRLAWITAKSWVFRAIRT